MLSSPHPKTRVTRTAGLILIAIAITLGAFSPLALSAAEPSTYRSLGRLTGGMRNRFSFMFASDSHLGYGPANRNTELALEDVVAHEKNIAFGVVVGDITETGAGAEYELFKGLTGDLPFPVMGAMGNHESKWQDPQGSLLASGIGPRNYSFEYGSWHFVVLDSTYPGQTIGTLEPATLEWLEKDLRAQPKTRPVAIFSHHPLLYEPSRFQDSDDAFASLLDKFPVRAVFCAHGHSFITWKGQGRDFLMTGALMDAAYTVVEVNGNSLTAYSVKVSPEGRERQKALEVRSRYWNTKKDPALNPISLFSAEPEGDVLLCNLSLAEEAEVSIGINGGTYVSLGTLGKGSHTLPQDIAGQAKGFHRVRVKAVTAQGPFYASREFGKSPYDLVHWRQDLGSAVAGELLPRGSAQVIVGTRDGKIRLFNIETGLEVWEYASGSPWGGGVIDGNRLYFGTAKGEVHCLDVGRGTGIWRASLDPAGFSAPPAIAAVSGGRSVVIGSSSGTLYSLNAVTGSKLWECKATGAIVSAPRFSGDRVTFGAWDGYLYSVDAETGTVMWSLKMGRQVYYAPYLSPVVYEGKVFATTPYDTHSGGALLAAYDLSSGEAVWSTRWPATLLSPSISRAGELVIPGANGSIYAFSPSDGTPLWRMDAGSTLFLAPPGPGPEYVSGGYRGLVTFLTHDAKTDFKVSDASLFVSPLIARLRSGTLVLFADSQGHLAAVRFPN
ncbi:MAG: PQQ-binding-like beta-propeller repeat protein [Bacillota bacterium]|jgi:outer membrane protein assembly factor BamB|nr:PQQ-binding-like beta-propeller repeat protein [Candidatus Fermentithermobacillaceae bacterium]